MRSSLGKGALPSPLVPDSDPIEPRVVPRPSGADAEPSRPRYLAIDLGVSRLAAGVVDDDGRILVRDRVTTPARHVWPALTRLVGRVLAASPEDVRPVACGVSCVGPVDHAAGSVTAPQLPIWHGFALRDEVGEATGLPVELDTGGRALARAEAWCGSAVDRPDFVALLVGDTVEGGIVARGRLLQGRSGNAGDLGHVVVEGDGRACRCGGFGCLDAYAGGASIEAETSRPLRRAPASIIERTGIMVGRAVASIAATVDVRLVVVAGSVPSAFGQPMFDAVDRELEQRSRLGHLRRLRVVPGSGGPLLGAAALARARQRRAEDAAAGLHQ
jgi:glucokinase